MKCGVQAAKKGGGGGGGAGGEQEGWGRCRNSYCIIFPLDTLHCWRFKWEMSLPRECFVSSGSILHLSLFWKDTIQEN
jgi:hypothetical protein